MHTRSCIVIYGIYCIDIKNTQTENKTSNLSFDYRKINKFYSLENLMAYSDQCQYLRNCAPTPLLTQQQSTDKNFLGLMLGQIPKLIRFLLKKAIFMLLGPHFVLNKSLLGEEKLVELHSNPSE